MLFGVRDQEFEIGFVNNFCREQYQQMLELVDELGDMPDEIDEITDDPDSPDKSKLRAIRDIQRRQRALVREIAKVRESIVRELLGTNGYAYDERWWLRETDADDMNTFALGCLQKDVKGPSRPKKR